MTDISASHLNTSATGKPLLVRVVQGMNTIANWVEALRDLSSAGRPSAGSLRVIGLDDAAIARVAKMKVPQA